MAAAGGGEGLFAALKHLIATGVAIGRTRLELLATELEEEKLRLLSLLVYALAAIFFLGVGLIIAVVLVAAAYWEHRVLVFALAATVFIGLGLACVGLAKGAARRGTPVFKQSLAELDADLASLKSQSGEKT